LRAKAAQKPKGLLPDRLLCLFVITGYDSGVDWSLRKGIAVVVLFCGFSRRTKNLKSFGCGYYTKTCQVSLLTKRE
jgi:hypothetical protein